MKNKLFKVLALSLGCALNSQLSTVLAQGTAFTYQGQLQNSGSLVSGTYNLTFSLFTNSTSGTAIATPVTNNAVAVTNGLFTVIIDFGASVWDGQTNWLQISVETNGVNTFTPLTPRQQLTPVPYAIYAENSSNLSGTISASQLTSIGNTSGNNENFFVGPSGNATTTGGYNTGDGFQALDKNTSGYANTAYGFQALYNNQAGYSDTAVGYMALTGNYSGYQNTAVGELAMYMGSLGDDNSAFGAAALGNNSSGSGNVAIGVDTLWYNGTGSYNTANGEFALYEASGSDNIGLGYQAGYNLNAGSSNIDIGSLGVATDTNLIRIGAGQTQAFIAGVITGNGAGLTNLNVSQSSGAISLSQLPAAVVTNNEPLVALGSLFLLNTLLLPATANISAGGEPLLYSDTNANSYFGVDAGASGKGGCNGNTALGALALSVNTTGTNNVAVGDLALGNCTGDNQLVAVGYQALENDNAYHQGSFFGNGDNTAVGNQALQFTTIGYDNTAIGYEALNQNTNGSENTANGSFALAFDKNGTGNIAVGYFAGESLLGNESDNIDIGNAGVAGENNIIRIGNGQSDTYLAGNVHAGGNVYANGMELTSDRNAKEDFMALNPQTVLAKVAGLPITEWNYKTTKNMEHIGPMAQDFHAAFGLNGADDKHISTVDEGGVALAAIQGLDQKVEEQAAQMKDKDTEIQDLKQRLEALEKIVLKEKSN